MSWPASYEVFRQALISALSFRSVGAGWMCVTGTCGAFAVVSLRLKPLARVRVRAAQGLRRSDTTAIIVTAGDTTMVVGWPLFSVPPSALVLARFGCGAMPQILISGRRRNGCTIIPCLGHGPGARDQSCTSV